jgi:hypothetical protein
MFYDVHVDVSELRRQTKWIGSDDTAAKANALRQIRGVLEKMKMLCTLGSKVNVAGRTMTVDEEMVPKSQNILRNLNAHSYILTILRGTIERKAQQGHDSERHGPALDYSPETEKRDLYVYRVYGIYS